MEPFKGQCSVAEQQIENGVVNISEKRSGYDCGQTDSDCVDKVDVINITNGSG